MTAASISESCYLVDVIEPRPSTEHGEAEESRGRPDTGGGKRLVGAVPLIDPAMPLL